MNLKEYIEETGCSITKMASRIGVTKATMHNLINGRDVRVSTCVKIERLTKGAVTCEDMFKVIEKKTSSHKTSSRSERSEGDNKNI